MTKSAFFKSLPCADYAMIIDYDNDGYQLFCQDCLVPKGKVLIHAHDNTVGDNCQDDHIPAKYHHHHRVTQRIVWGHRLTLFRLLTQSVDALSLCLLLFVPHTIKTNSRDGEFILSHKQLIQSINHFT